MYIEAHVFNFLGGGYLWLEKLLEPGHFPTVEWSVYGLLMLLPQVIYFM